MTSPLTSDGTQSEPRRRLRSHSSHVCSGALAGLALMGAGRARIARHERGLASTSASASPGTADGSVLAVERVAARVAREHDRVRAGREPLGPPAQQLLRLALVVGALQRLDVLAPLLAPRAIAPRLALQREHPERRTRVAPNSSTKPKATQRERCSSSCARCSTCSRSAASCVRKRSMSTLRSRASVDADRPRAAALDLVDRGPRVRLPPARRRGRGRGRGPRSRARGRARPVPAAAPRSNRRLAAARRARGTPGRRSARSRAGPSPGRASPVSRSLDARSWPCMPITASRCCPAISQTLPPITRTESASSSRRRA